jgi:class 3 adenylate cyclase/tetratricopeptide (TPR) repeat protein
MSAADADIASWLASLELSQYAALFVENGIDVDVLAELTDLDLKEIGVLLGHRRKLLRAIRELGPGNPKAASSSPIPADLDTPRGAERRQISVMFTDLVDSTVLSTQIDPEDLREVIAAYHKCVREIMITWGGFVAKYMGDGVLIYFGYPVAHELDTEHAVRAGIALTEAVPKLVTPAKKPLQVRVGISTGLVVVGDLVGSGESQERGIVGETANLAARLQALAEPGAVLIGEDTQKLLGNLFDLKSLGPRQLKGIAGPIETYIAVGPSTHESRFDAMHAWRQTPLVGRDEEMSLLLRRWERAKSGEGQVILLSGEPGIGKSRLSAALVEQMSAEPHHYRRYVCSPHHSNTAFYPILQRMERAAGFQPQDNSSIKRKRLLAMLGEMSTPPEDVELFADLLSLPTEKSLQLDLTSQQRRQRTIEAMVRRIRSLAHDRPMLAIFEDAHWSDPSSLEVLNQMIAQTRDVPVLIVITFRPEFNAQWTGLSYVTLLVLNRLGKPDSQNMVRRAVSGNPLSRDIIDEIVLRTDGVPLFLEEMTKAVIEAGSGQTVRRQLERSPLSRLAVPATLHGSLMARLDRLGDAKDIAQIGAVIGREFSYELLFRIADRNNEDLTDALDRLVAAGLLLRQGVPPSATFVFKHALIQDIAYGTLLRKARRELHARLAVTLRDNFPELGETDPATLAHHYTEAELTKPAIECWLKAGERDLRLSSSNEAISIFEKALRLSEPMPEDATRRQLQMRLYTMYGQALFHVRGQAAPETVAAFAKAQELAAGSATNDDRFSAYWGLWVASFARAELKPMNDVAQEFLNDVGQQPSAPEMSVAHRIFGVTKWFEGNYAEARRYLERSISDYRPEWEEQLASRFVYNTNIITKCHLAAVLWPLGETGPAVDLMKEAVNAATQNGHGPTLAVTYIHACLFANMRRAGDEALSLSELAIPLARDLGLPLLQASSRIHNGWGRWWTGDQTGEQIMREGAARMREVNFRPYDPHVWVLLAELEARSGRTAQALATIDEQLAAIDATGERWMESEAYRIRGEILLSSGLADFAGVEAALSRAIEISCRQKTRTFGLRAALSLATLYRATDRDYDAHGLLKAALKGFDESSELPEVTQAHSLLDRCHVEPRH